MGGLVGGDRSRGGAVAAIAVGDDVLSGGAAAHADDDGAVFDGVGHGPDACEGGHGEGGDGVDGLR